MTSTTSDFTTRARAALTKTAGVVAHVAGPSGSGKTTLLRDLSKTHPSVVGKDMDDFDDEASEKLFPGVRKSDYSKDMVSTLAAARQKSMDDFVNKNKGKDIVLAGHHVEGKTVLKIPTSNKVLLDTSPFISAWRGYRRSQNQRPDHRRSLTELPSDWREARDTRRELVELGYKPGGIEHVRAILDKTAALNPGVKLQPHQSDAVTRSRDSGGMILNWGLGSGKTIGALALAESKGGNVLVVTPAALRENFRGQLKAHVSPLRHGAYTVISYDEFRRDPEGWVARSRPTTVIADELQRLRNAAPREPFEKVRGSVKFMVGLTGSLVSNRPEEMVPLVNLVAGQPVLGSQEDFKRRFISQKKVSPGIIGTLLGAKPGIEESPKNLKELGRLTAPVIHRFTGDKDFAQHMPVVSEKTVAVPMDPRQETMMRALSTSNPVIAFKLRHNLPTNKKELKDMNAFLSAARQISNQPSTFSTKDISSPKFKTMLDDLVSGHRRDKNFKAVIYSNFIDSGVAPLVSELNKKGIPAAAFTGSLNDAQRRALVADFNAGKIKVLGLTPAGGEGLDLKGVKMIQLTEEHWNPERGKQAIGRGARFKSHAHLPEAERQVDVRRYQAVHNPGIWNKLFRTQPPTSADQWIDARRREKAEMNAKFTGAVPEYNLVPKA
jgi:hypothetical protein